ncbi:MAG: response regulator [Anaerolineae bacterium]|nr:response regulator [Anaerolineae bacterium]
MAGERILVIDDNREICEILRELILGPHGYRVATALDGEAGVALALREQPDLILVDVNMPRMTGIEVLETLREAEYQWPVILMTFHGSEDIAVQAFRLGVRDYIRKPFAVEEVLTSVERALVESRLRREREQLLQRLEGANQQLNRQVAELTTLYAIGQAVTSVLDLEVLLNRVVEASVYLCRAQEGSLYLIDKESGALHMTAALVAPDRTAHSVHHRVNDSVLTDVVRSGQPAVLSSESTRPELKMHTGHTVYALVNVPLRVKEQIIGALAVANRSRQRNFTQADVTRLSGLANYAAIAIENARLVEATHKVIAAEVLHNTVVTISHYINNPLMALRMSVDHLVRTYRAGETEDLERYVDETERFTEMKVEEISAVISILRDIASPQFITYIDDIKMLDIDHKVQDRLRYIKEKYRG